MEEFLGMGRRDAIHLNLQDRAKVRQWARALGIPEAEVVEAVKRVGASAEAVFLYFHAPD